MKNKLTPVARTTLTADIYRKLVGQIIQGSWPPGGRIPPENQLGQMLGVGRASLREALKALEIMGMIETRLGDGTYVCQRSEFMSRPLLWAIASSSGTDAQELVEARKLIETEMAGLAAERATDKDLEEIRSHLDRMAQSLESPGEFLEADIEFHLAVGQAAHNTILMNALHLIRNLLREWISSTLQNKGVSQLALDHHRAICLAIERKDGTTARIAMDAHLSEMARHLLQAQKKPGSTLTDSLRPDSPASS